MHVTNSVSEDPTGFLKNCSNMRYCSKQISVTPQTQNGEERNVKYTAVEFCLFQATE